MLAGSEEPPDDEPLLVELDDLLDVPVEPVLCELELWPVFEPDVCDPNNAPSV